MKNTFNASKLSFLFLLLTLFGCKETLFDSPAPQVPNTEVASPAPVTSTSPAIPWWEDTSEVVLPISDKKPIDPSYRRGNETPTIVILGSSSAKGKGASTSSKAWVELMKSKLKKDNKIVRVVNLSEGGYTTYHIMPDGNKVANRPAPDKARNITKALSYKPFLIIINLPTKDVEKKYTDKEILNNYAKLRTLVVKENVNYLVTGTQPRNFTEKSQRTRLLELNEQMVSLDPAHIVDVLKKLSIQSFKIKKTYAFTDGIHPNDRGHAVINGYVFNAPLFKQLMGYTAVNP